MPNAGYFRMPTVAGDTVVFVSEDDLWTAPLAGGIARRLTANLGEIHRPALSRDGRILAYTGREEHHFEVYVMPAEGGPQRRLTFWGVNTFVAGWTPEGEILFRSDHAQPFRGIHRLYALSPDGGHPRPLPLGHANEASFGPRGGVVLGRNTADPARWKRYRGGTAGVLWVDARGSGSFRRLIALDGNMASPMWVGGRIYFLSDHEGIGNLYSCRPDGRDLRRHTDHGEHYARLAQTDGRTIVYQHAAEAWALDVEADRARRVDIDFPSTRTQRNRKFADAADYLHSYAVHPGGHSLTIEARGKPFTMPLWEEAVRHHGAADGVRYRLGRWLPDGKRIVCVSDESGEERIQVFSTDGPEPRRLEADVGRVHALAVNPKRDLVAVANHRLELIVVDLANGRRTVVDRSRFARMLDPAWSPDGRWLAYSCAETYQTRSIKLAEMGTRRTHVVTRPDFRDHAPAFDPEGRYLYFLSYRLFDPVYDAHFFDLGFPRGAKPYAIALRTDVPDPFVPKPKGMKKEKRDEDRDGDRDPEKKDEKKEEPLRIDLDGIGDRIVAFPVPEARYGQIAGIKGKVLFTSFPVEGGIGQWSEEYEPKGSIDVYDLEELKHETLISGANDFEIGGDTLVYRAGKRLRAVRAGERPDDKFEHDPPGRRSGWIDLRRLRVSIDPGAEWAQMFGEAWRMMRDNFWTPDMSGVDWKRVRGRYRPLVDKVATRWEFSDLMWETQGELGTSHCYEFGGDYRQPPAYTMGFLAADVSWDARARGYRIDHIVRGDPWENGRSSPLGAPGIDVREGDVVLAVNGRPVTREVPPQAHLVHQAGQMVELTVRRGRAGPRQVVVKTLRDERDARYREWVERNRARVHEATGGKVGYVHVPDMGPHGFAEFHRYYLSEVDRPALLVDVRFNAGGHVSQLILEKLARRRIGYAVQRWGEPEPYPSDSVLGPMIALTNEWAGSDGDIFTHCFKLMEVGTVVGKRTWGGVIGIWVRHPLADNSWTSQPEFAFWFSDVGWGVENYGTDPDVEVDIRPQDYAAGRDPQMETALRLVTAELRRAKPRLPDFSKRPSLTLPTLPPRRGARR